MTIRFLGSTPSDLGSGLLPDTGLVGRDPDFTPVGSVMTATKDDLNNAGKGFGFSWETGGGTDLWMHFRVHFNFLDPNSQLDGWWCRFFTDNSEFARIDLKDANFYVECAGGSTLLAGIAQGTDLTFNFHFQRDGVNTTMSVYSGGSLLGTATGASALALPNHTTFDHYDFGYVDSTIRYFYYSEFMVAEGESTIGWRLSTLDASVAGNYSAWQGDYTGVNTLGDGTGISGASVGDKESWLVAAYAGPASPAGIRAVVNKYTARVGPTGPQNILPFVRIGAVDYAGAALDVSGLNAMHVLDNDPSTALPWTTAALAALEVGVQADT